MTDTLFKTLACIILFATWVYLVTMRIPESGELIAFIKYALVGLGAHTAATPKGSS